MDDLASMITQFLSSEEGMNQLRSVTAALGLPDPGSAGPQAGQNSFVPPQTGNASPNSGGIPFFSSESSSSQAGAPPLDLNTLMLMQRAISALNQDDRNTELLRALKPHFSDERAKKVDDAIRILQLIRLLPLVKELGLFNRLKGGDNK
ncbi:hypothetical protein ACS3UN_03045 [Oscillospiraceae bacterium LTW-04]|nr:hypothetical protein RBH76_07415 [Oscillospiraceae bacterium MB24-C1]